VSTLLNRKPNKKDGRSNHRRKQRINAYTPKIAEMNRNFDATKHHDLHKDATHLSQTPEPGC
jgi:hypothetical protein